MNSTQLHQVSCYLADRGRSYRLAPVTELRSVEAFDQVERLFNALWRVGSSLNLQLGNKPTIIRTGANTLNLPELLQSLTSLEIEVLATFLMTGLGAAHSRAVYELVRTPLGKPSPQYKIILDETFTDDEIDLPSPSTD